MLNKFIIERAKFDRMDFKTKCTEKSDNSSRTSLRAGMLTDHNTSREIQKKRFFRNFVFKFMKAILKISMIPARDTVRADLSFFLIYSVPRDDLPNLARSI